jgi:hypothetical protein
MSSIPLNELAEHLPFSVKKKVLNFMYPCIEACAMPNHLEAWMVPFSIA